MRSLLILILLVPWTVSFANPQPSQSLIQDQSAPPTSSDESTAAQVGGDVKAPVLVRSVDPKYPRAWFGKNTATDVLVGLIVSEKGLPENLHIVRSGGVKFDKNAMETVSKYRFKPATKEGKPIPVHLNVDVSYQVF
jgi:TonB family protein